MSLEIASRRILHFEASPKSRAVIKKEADKKRLEVFAFGIFLEALTYLEVLYEQDSAIGAVIGDNLIFGDFSGNDVWRITDELKKQDPGIFIVGYSNRLVNPSDEFGYLDRHRFPEIDAFVQKSERKGPQKVIDLILKNWRT